MFYTPLPLLCICKVEVIHRRTTQMSPLEITLVILLVTIIAFVYGKVPFSVISTGIILALILTGIKTPAEPLAASSTRTWSCS